MVCFILHFLVTVTYLGKSRQELKQDRNLGQQLRQIPWRNIAYWFAQSNFLYVSVLPASGAELCTIERPSHINH